MLSIDEGVMDGPLWAIYFLPGNFSIAVNLELDGSLISGEDRPGFRNPCAKSSWCINAHRGWGAAWEQPLLLLKLSVLQPVLQDFTVGITDQFWRGCDLFMTNLLAYVFKVNPHP